MRKSLSAVAVGLLAVAAAPVISLVTAAPAIADSYNGLALTPPMGFNDWNVFGCNVSAAQLEALPWRCMTMACRSRGI